MLVDELPLSGLCTRAFRSIHKKLTDDTLTKLTRSLEKLIKGRESFHLLTFVQQVDGPIYNQIEQTASTIEREYCFYLCFVRMTLKEASSIWMPLDDIDDYYPISQRFVRLRSKNEVKPLPHLQTERLKVLSRLTVEKLQKHPDYQEYLWSNEWREKRTAVLRRAKGKCEQCSVEDKLSVHHLHYHTLGFEDILDIQALCKTCHEKADRERVEGHQ